MIGQLVKVAVVLGSLASVSAHPKFGNARPAMIEIRQAAPAVSNAPTATSAGSAASATPAAGNITDVDILQFALTLEHLEATFYNQGFAKFPDSQFMSLGLTQNQVSELKTVGGTESTHVNVLTSAITAAGAQPVQECTYGFNFTTPQNMITTARVLEAVGISAYLGAAPLIKSSAVLVAAGEILPIEARHQTFIRTVGNFIAVPNAFETPLSVRSVWTLASPFIQSCPPGSNLNIQAFPSIALQGGGAGIQAGQSLVLANPGQPAGAAFCAFSNLGQTMYAPLTNGACQVPQGLTGDVYMAVTSSQSMMDSAILAGPSVILAT